MSFHKFLHKSKGLLILLLLKIINKIKIRRLFPAFKVQVGRGDTVRVAPQPYSTSLPEVHSRQLKLTPNDLLHQEKQPGSKRREELCNLIGWT